MDFRQIGVVARREYIATVKRREFLLVTIGLPLFYLFIAFVAGGATMLAARSQEKNQAPPVVGFFDQSGKLSHAALTGKQDDLSGVLYNAIPDGQKAVRDKKIRAFVIVPSDFAKSGKVTVYRDSGGSFAGSGRMERETARFSNALKTALLLQSGVTTQTAKRALAPVESKTYLFNRKTNRFEEPNDIREIGRYAVPYGFSLLLMLSILISSSYLLAGVVEEKENRVIEVLLSSLTHAELLAGKMVGLGLSGLTQIGIWALGGALPVLFLPNLQPVLANLNISPLVWVTGFAMFICGFALFASLMAGLGSMGTTWRESQQMSSVAATFSVLPLMLFPAIVEQPDGVVARSLSFFPLTAPVGMMLRVGAGGGSWLELVLCIVLVAGATTLSVAMSAKLFQLSLLMYGQKPTGKEIWRALTYRAA